MNNIVNSIRALRSGRVSVLSVALMIALCWNMGVGSSSSPAQSIKGQTLNQEIPDVAKDIGVDSKTGNSIEMDLRFHDSENNSVNLGRYFDGKKPVMLSFNYSNCPKLCSVQLENMTTALRDVDLIVGKDFEVVSISMDPLEQSSRAKQTKEKYVHLYGKPESKDGFHFLTGDEDAIQMLADDCGFKFKYVPKQKIYSHPPVFILLSPEGKIVRYIHGLDYEAKTIRLALIESAKGNIGSPINWLAYGLGCYMFNESTGQYSFQAIAMMRIGGAITVFLLLVTLVPYWFLRRNQTPASENGSMPLAAGN